MAALDPKAFQSRIGVIVDGDLGIGTWTTFFTLLGASTANARDLAHCAKVYFPEYGLLDDVLRLTHFCGQCSVESDRWKAMEEYASGSAYEGRVDLGNINPGDGKLYKGRGPIQCTGRANYRRIGQQIGIDLERYPALVANPSIGLRASLQWWRNNNMNKWADLDDASAVSRGVNRGNPQSSKPANHEAERIQWTNRVRKWTISS
jgi:putative chitinase